MTYQLFLKWIQDFFTSASQIGGWLTSDLSIGSIHISPLVLVTAGGLVAFLAIAIIKWILI